MAYHRRFRRAAAVMTVVASSFGISMAAASPATSAVDLRDITRKGTVLGPQAAPPTSTRAAAGITYDVTQPPTRAVPTADGVLDPGVALWNQTVLSNLFANLQSGDRVVFPVVDGKGTYLHNNTLNLATDGVRIDGLPSGSASRATLLAMPLVDHLCEWPSSGQDEGNGADPSHPDPCRAIWVRGNDIFVNNLVLDSAPGYPRGTTPQSCGLVLKGTGNWVNGITSKNAGCGVHVRGATDFAITNTELVNTGGASLIVHNGPKRPGGLQVITSGGQIAHLTVRDPGDDGFCVESWPGDAARVNDVHLSHYTYVNTKTSNTTGRAISVVGGENISADDVNATGAPANAVAVTSGGSWENPASSDVTVSNGTFTNSGTLEGPNGDNGALWVTQSDVDKFGQMTDITFSNILLRDTLSAYRQIGVIQYGAGPAPQNIQFEHIRMENGSTRLLHAGHETGGPFPTGSVVTTSDWQKKNTMFGLTYTPGDSPPCGLPSDTFAPTCPPA